MGLLTHKEQHGDAQDFDLKCADQLRSAAARRFGSAMPKKINLAKWAHHFRLLRSDLKQDTVRIEKVLDWYAAYLATPESSDKSVRTAQSFRRFFSMIEKKYHASGLRPSADTVPKEKIEAFLTFVKETTFFTWPEHVEKQIRDYLICSYAAYMDYRERVKKLWEERENHRSVRWFIENVKEKLGSPEIFLTWWLSKFRTLVREWEEFNGNAKPFIFNVRHRWFTEKMLDQARHFGSKPEEWYTILKLMGYGDAD